MIGFSLERGIDTLSIVGWLLDVIRLSIVVGELFILNRIGFSLNN
jgi:hypothetical protein